MDDVIWYSGNPPCYCHAPSSYEQIRYRAEHPEKQSEKSGQYTIKPRSDFIPVSIVYDDDQQRPYVEIHK